MTSVEVFRIDTNTPASARKSHDGIGQSESRTIADLKDVSVRMGTWIAEPGTYSSPGVPTGEWFVVLEGAGELMVEGHEIIALAPGVVVHTGAYTSSQLRVHQKLSKVSLIGL